ncbi:MAG: DMT family transporter [Gammaproteobacteria bacterium]
MKNPEIEKNTDVVIGLIFVLIGAICFSAKAIFIKLAYAYGAHVDALSLIMLRMVIALPFFLLVAFINQQSSEQTSISMKEWIAIIFLGIIGYYLASLFDFMGLELISAGLERIILFLYPTFVVLLSAVFLKRKINRLEIFALLLSYAGITFVVIDQIEENSEGMIRGIIYIVISAFTFAIFLMGSGEMTKRIGATRFTAYAMSISCFVTIMHYCFSYGFSAPEFEIDVYYLAFLIAIISTVIPAFLMNAGIRRVGASKASIISSIGPISTLFMAYVFLGEQITFIQMVGTVLVILGVCFVSRSKTNS